MVLDRSQAPPIHENIKINIPSIQRFELENGLDVYEINMGTQSIIKLEIVFDGGRIFEEKKLCSRATASLLKEATNRRNQKELAEKIDYYGASIISGANMDNSSLTLICLEKHFEPLLNLMVEIWTGPAFPEEELIRYKKKAKQQLRINLAKNEVLAYRQFTERIFGSSHPYGFNSSEDSYDAIVNEDLMHHYKCCYFSKNTKVFISGLVNDSHRNLLQRYLGTVPLKDESPQIYCPAATNGQAKRMGILGAQDYQTAIRIGKKLFNRQHEDYPSFYFLNIIFGGYFGSRLMKNLREDKAYTYGIHSLIDTLRFDGYFTISTEVGNEYLKDTLKEIYFEINRLKDSLITDHELKMARNYLFGQFLNMLDGPLKVSQVLKTMVVNGFDLNFIDKMTSQITSTSKEDLRDLAIKYLPEEELWEVCVGTQVK